MRSTARASREQAVTERKGIIDRLADYFVPLHPDGQKFVAVSAGATLVAFLIAPALGWPLAVLTVWIAYFFRDPDRVVPLREGLVVSAADGRVIAIEEAEPDVEFGFAGETLLRISVHLSLFDVHINRAPAPGMVRRVVDIPGAFLNPTLDKASTDNERRLTVIALRDSYDTSRPGGTGLPDDDAIEIGISQIAGVIARRIVGFVDEGQAIGVGERIGLIRFGSRVDVWLPRDTSVLVAVGQRVIAGETVIADLKADEPRREARVI